MELKICPRSDSQVTQLHTKGGSGLRQRERQGGAGEQEPGQKLPELRRAAVCPGNKNCFGRNMPQIPPSVLCHQIQFEEQFEL